MAIVNKVTKLFPKSATSLSEDDIQAHLDQQNADGWYLITLDNMVGWYRFFWGKENV